MIKRFFLITVVLILAYGALIQWKLWMRTKAGLKGQGSQEAERKTSQRVYSFSFSKYTSNGERELDIAGDSADIFTRNVALMNVIAKAYAEESPVTVTADQGTFDKVTGNVYLRNNVVATTENGARLITERLDIHPSDRQIQTDIEANLKKDNINIEGTGALSDSGLRKVTFKKNVTVVVQNPDSKTNTPTIITCDGPLNIDYKKNVAHFSKNVVTQDENGKLKADFMDVFYDNTTHQVSKIVARGNVIVESKDGNTTYSDSAVYLAEEGRVILGGDVEAQYVNEESFGGLSGQKEKGA